MLRAGVSAQESNSSEAIVTLAKSSNPMPVTLNAAITSRHQHNRLSICRRKSPAQAAFHLVRTAPEVERPISRQVEIGRSLFDPRMQRRSVTLHTDRLCMDGPSTHTIFQEARNG